MTVRTKEGTAMRSSHSRTLASMLLAVLSIGGATTATAAPFILVSNIESGTVSVIDAASHTVATTVPVAASALLGVAVAPDGTFAYVGGFSGAVYVIDTAAGIVTDAIPVGYGPRNFAFTRDGSLAYVVDQYSDVVWVIDTESRTVVDSIDLPSVFFPHGYVSIAIAPDDSRVYVVDTLGDLLVVDPSANRVVATVKVGDRSSEVVLSLDGALAYVTNGPGGISVVNTSTAAVIDAIPVGPVTFIAIAPGGRLAYASGGNSVSAIDLVTRRVVGAPIPVGEAPADLLITPDERFVYVANQGGVPCALGYCGSVSVIETTTNTVIATVPVGRHPAFLSIAPGFTLVPPPECADGVDNDGDGSADWGSDPGCDSPADESEKSPAFVCDDGLDNDGDGLVDYPSDPGCASPTYLEDPACNNGIDDDGDGFADFPADPGCDSPAAESEKSGTLACDDGKDNDYDGLTDYPADLDCRSPGDGIEETDVDGDGVAPPEYDNCVTVFNPSQVDSNGDRYGDACDADYDDDGVVGSYDLVRLRRAFGATLGSPDYDPALDADGDGVIGGAEFDLLRASFGSPPGPSTQCAEGGRCCGIGFELVFMLLPLQWVYRRRRFLSYRHSSSHGTPSPSPSSRVSPHRSR